MSETGLSCPINDRRVNENVVRIIAFLVVLTATFALALQSIILVGILLCDFGLRAFSLETFSPFRWIATQIVALLHIGSKPTNYGPKLFAVRLGLSAVAAWFVFAILGSTLPFWIVGSMLVIFATLESGFAICVGCIIYQHFTNWGIIKISA